TIPEVHHSLNLNASFEESTQSSVVDNYSLASVWRTEFCHFIGYSLINAYVFEE
ncbi:18474_t:CDS:1, partial [Racocetra persica]